MRLCMNGAPKMLSPLLAAESAMNLTDQLDFFQGTDSIGFADFKAD